MPRWRKDSIFGDGPRQPLDRNARARFRFLIRAHRGVNRLTANDVDVAEVLVSALGDDGRLDLAHSTIAERALCHVATVRRALARLRDVGLVSWVRRLVRGPGTAWRAAQTSNAYVLRTAALFDAPLPSLNRLNRFTARAPCYSQASAPRPAATADDIAAAREALARRRRVIEGALPLRLT